MYELPEELKEDIMRLAKLDMKERPKKCCYLIAVDASGKWSLAPRLYEIKEKKDGSAELKPFKYKVKKEELKAREKLSDKIIGRLDKPIRDGIGKEIKKALIEKPLSFLQDMAASKGKVQFERRRGCFWLIDKKNNQFSL
jgi:hypothetical protein